MNTLRELIYYCKQPSVQGALMLSGEWGCGKTYLVETDLKNALADTHFIVRISLFGIESIDALKLDVRKKWLAACLPAVAALEKHEEAINRGKDLVDHSLQIAGYFNPALKKLKEIPVFNDNAFELVAIQNQIKTLKGMREFVLVFDDLERTKLNVADVLGCINEYCENLHFKVIIIANESKITTPASFPFSCVNNATSPISGVYNANITYLELKEKIICRTVRCKLNFNSIIHDILTNAYGINKEYQRFLLENEQLILSIFDQEQGEVGPTHETGVKPTLDNSSSCKLNRSRNIRSLRYALSDFFRVYKCLTRQGNDNLCFYLYNFIIFMMTVKSNVIDPDTDDETIHDAISRIYPLYDRRYLLQAEKDWIMYGDWDEKRIIIEEELLRKSESAVDLNDRMRLNTVLDLDEDEIREGFPSLLKDCYEGKLSLNEYVTLIQNASYIRHYKIQIPCEIDWDRVLEGIRIRFRDNIDKQNEECFIYRSIPEKDREQYSAQELEAYDYIAKFRSRNAVIYENNRQLYLNELGKSSISAFAACEKRRFNCFDEEMAQATASCYQAAAQAEKRRFSVWFEVCWSNCVSNPDCDLEKTSKGFALLNKLLESLRDEYRQQKLSVAVKHTTAFLTVLDKLTIQLNAITRS